MFLRDILNKAILGIYIHSEKFKVTEYSIEDIYEVIRNNLTATDKSIAGYLKTLYQLGFFKWNIDKTKLILTDKFYEKGKELFDLINKKVDDVKEVEHKTTDESGFYKY